jgi:putative transposase
VILASDSDRSTYLALLRQYSELHRLALLGYRLMSNHVHLVVIPHGSEALAQALKHAHGRYAAYWMRASFRPAMCGRGDSIRVPWRKLTFGLRCVTSS